MSDNCTVFWAAVFRHISGMDSMHRNRRGADKRHYIDLRLKHVDLFPCGCKPLSHQSSNVRLYEDGQIEHLGCWAKEPYKVPENQQQMLLLSISERNAARSIWPRSKKKHASELFRPPYRTGWSF